jgi:concentrative nucleoside transporter, CNT family
MFEGVLRGAGGLVLLLGIAWLLSTDRRRIDWPLVGKGLLIQIIFGTLVIRGDVLGAWWAPLGWLTHVFEFISRGFVKLLSFTTQGAQFVVGTLALSPGTEQSLGFFFVFQVLPTIIFFASLLSVLYHLGIMQRVVQLMAWIVQKILGTSGAESLSATANIFVGQTEAPLLVRPYLNDMTRSEINTVMVGGFATIAGGVMAAYVQVLGASYAASHGLTLGAAQVKFAAQLLGASIMAAPAGIVLSKMLVPETGQPRTRGHVHLPREKNASNVIEAAAMGAGDGMKLVLNIAAMLLAFIALIALGNYLLELVGRIGDLNGWLVAQTGRPLSLQLIFGMVFQFLAVGIGVPWSDAYSFGTLIGTKIVLNEFVAYLDLSKMIELGQITNEKTIAMLTFALCGFANFASIAIQIGGITPIAPDRQKDIAALGMRALLGGVLATLMTATIAGVLFGL